VFSKAGKNGCKIGVKTCVSLDVYSKAWKNGACAQFFFGGPSHHGETEGTEQQQAGVEAGRRRVAFFFLGRKRWWVKAVVCFEKNAATGLGALPNALPKCFRNASVLLPFCFRNASAFVCDARASGKCLFAGSAGAMLPAVNVLVEPGVLEERSVLDKHCSP
jgi:hypothetical protein